MFKIFMNSRQSNVARHVDRVIIGRVRKVCDPSLYDIVMPPSD